MIAVSYGGGVNSTALLIGAHERGLRPDMILFADTGGEKPETYEFIKAFGFWLTSVAVGFPPITVVKNKPDETLEEECHRNGTLPSLAFGFRGCSVKWKRQPMDRHLRDVPGLIERWIGIDADERHRGKIEDTKRFCYRFPLLEWDWGRDECVKAIQRHDITVPPKSACFFCPAMRKQEVLDLSAKHTSLWQRAVAIERNARKAGNLKVVKGLGRHWSWEELLRAECSQRKLWPELEIPCMCYDGEGRQET